MVNVFTGNEFRLPYLWTILGLPCTHGKSMQIQATQLATDVLIVLWVAVVSEIECGVAVKHLLISCIN